MLAAELRRQGVLHGVKVSTHAVTLAPRASRVVEIQLASVPRGGYLYGAVVVRGVASQKGSGLRPTYQIAGALHVEPPTARQRLALRASTPRASRRGHSLLITVPVSDRGDMTDPIGATVTVRGRGRARSARIRAGPILPKHLVRLPATSLRGLRAGHYRVTASVTQGGWAREHGAVLPALRDHPQWRGQALRRGGSAGARPRRTAGAAGRA